MSKGVKNYMQLYWQKLITVAKGKAKIEMSPFSSLYIPFEAYFKPDVVLVKTCKLEHLFSENSLSFLNHNLVPRGSVVFEIHNFSLCLQQNTLEYSN